MIQKMKCMRMTVARMKILKIKVLFHRIKITNRAREPMLEMRVGPDDFSIESVRQCSVTVIRWDIVFMSIL